MAYRNGTYIAFHAEGSSDPTASDIKYYRMLLAWHANDSVNFKFFNSHDKVSAVRDSSQDATIKRSLRERLDNSKNMVLIIGKRTKFDTDFVPYEIAYAVDRCNMPIIAAYVGYEGVTEPSALKRLWPAALAERIADQSASVVHVPFKRGLIDDAIGRFTVNNLPDGPLVHYTREAHRSRGIVWI